MAGGGGQGTNQGGVFGMLSKIGQAEQLGNPGSPGFVAPSQLGQQASYRPSAPTTASQLSPFAQQMMQRSMAPQPIMGLPAALMQMQGQLNQPLMRGPMPTYRSPALNYRPNMAPAMEALNRVRPSVYKTELDAARDRIAELEAAQQPQQDTGYYSGG